MIKHKELVGDDSSDTGHQNNGFINGSECSAGLIILVIFYSSFRNIKENILADVLPFQLTRIT